MIARTESNRSPVIIAGGGIGGLSLSLALAARGIASVVLERADAFTEVGAGIQLGPNAMHALNGLGVGDAVVREGVLPATLEVRDLAADRLLKRTPLGEEARRHSTVKQWASGYILLDAELEINTGVLPDALMHLLHATSKPFGELLCEFGFKVRLNDMTPFRQGSRFGRRHTIRLAETGAALCGIRELLAPERDLRNAEAFYSDGGQIQ